MPDEKPPEKLSRSAERMIREVGAKQDRITRGKGESAVIRSIAILGVVGWSVTVPTLLGVVAGLWADRHWPQRFSWTLTLLITGLVLGCVNAWMQINKER